MNAHALFANRPLVIATKHAKEQVIAPILEEAIGVDCRVADGLDTDLLGTFSGEVERALDPLATAREKCQRAMAATGVDLAVASEGSFGPHPSMVFLPSDEEILLLVDRRHGLEIVAREVSTSTNFAQTQVESEEALLAFAQRVGFPEHGLILRRSVDGTDHMTKGVTDRETLLAVFRALKEAFGSACVETDMRAMHNPTRQAVIADAARQLARLLTSCCPGCAMPGFTVTEVVRGLPCELCGLPTRGASRHVSRCQHCGCEREQRYPNGKTVEDSMYCEFCNP